MSAPAPLRRAVVAAALVLGALVPAAGAAIAAPPAVAVLRVGTYHGIPGPYASVQDAVDAAHPGDWILVAPGDHKATTSRAPAGATDAPAGVLVTTPHLTLRGMDRDTTIVDGTRSGPACSTAAGDQSFGPAGGGGPLGRNGIMVWKADDVAVENLTVCNFLAGSGDTGNELWWNGGDGSGTVGGWGFQGSYDTATTTYYADEMTAAKYGIFSSNWSGGTWDQTYASNFNDSGYYIGACQQVCDQTIDHAWAEYNALGYSGSNSGGRLVVERSEFDHNEDGFDTNSQNGDNPPPQDGTCPNGAISPITHTTSCWVFLHNYVHDNNDPDVPSSGSAAAGPVGTGLSISGGRHDTVMDNVFERNDAWGTILVPYPDSGPPCTGGLLTPVACLFDQSGNAVIGNTYRDNGSYGNPTNGDLATVNLQRGPTDCFRGNTEGGGGAPTTSPPALQVLSPQCTGQTALPDPNPVFLAEVACDSQSISIGVTQGGTLCLPGSNYPRRTQVVLHPLPGATALDDPAAATLPSMPDPCAGVPANPWCPSAPAPAPPASPTRVVAATRGRTELPATGGKGSTVWLGLTALGLGLVGATLRRRRVRICDGPGAGPASGRPRRAAPRPRPPAP